MGRGGGIKVKLNRRLKFRLDSTVSHPNSPENYGLITKMPL